MKTKQNKKIKYENVKSWQGGWCSRLVVMLVAKNTMAQSTKPKPAKNIKTEKIEKYKNKSSAPRFKPRTWVPPVCYFTTGVAVHPLSNVKQK